MSIREVFCSVDEFWQEVAPAWTHHLVVTGQRRRQRPTHLHPSKIMPIRIWFHPSHSHSRTFKASDSEYVPVHLRGEFPQLVSYPRFVELTPAVLAPLLVYPHTQMGTSSSTGTGTGTGSSFVDSTALAVCQNARIPQHRVFAATARRGKTSVGWFYGFKRHLVVTDRGELLAFSLTPGNVDDRQPVPQMLAHVKHLVGKLIGDKGYLSQALTEHLLVAHGIHLVAHGVHLVTKPRKNMRNVLLDASDKLLLRKRALIETIHDPLQERLPDRALPPS